MIMRGSNLFRFEDLLKVTIDDDRFNEGLQKLMNRKRTREPSKFKLSNYINIEYNLEELYRALEELNSRTLVLENREFNNTSNIRS